MSLRQRFADDLKTAMRSGDQISVATLRLMIARMKEVDIAARPRGVDGVGEDELVAMLRGMVKQRNDSIALFRQGGREELAAREAAEIAVIDRYLPAGLDDAALGAAVDAAIAATGASTSRDFGRVMGALKAAHGGALDMTRASEAVRARLA